MFYRSQIVLNASPDQKARSSSNMASHGHQGGRSGDSSETPFELLMPGAEAADIVAPACVGGVLRTFYLSEFAGKFILLLFYPNDFPIVASQEVLHFASLSGEFRRLDCELVAVSTDSHLSHLAYSDSPNGLAGKCDFPLVSDRSSEISAKYGMLREEWNVCHRGSVLIDPWSVVKTVIYHGSAVPRNALTYYNLVAAHRLLVGHDTEERKCYCPEGWQPGEDILTENRATKRIEHVAAAGTRRPSVD